MGRTRQQPRGRIWITTLAIGLAGTAVGTAGPASAGGGCHRAETEGQDEGTGTTVEMRQMCFGPTVLRVEAGSEVTFINRDEVTHRLDGVGWGSDLPLAPGTRTTHRFDQPGTYPYTCILHIGMSGAVVVGHGRGSGQVVEVAPATVLSAAAPPPAPTASRGGGVGAWWFLATAALTVGAWAAGATQARRRTGRS
jgi:plastocyanin